MTTSRESIRDYLLTQSASHDWHELWPRVMAQRAALLEALGGVSEAQARWRPGIGEGEDAWSIFEVGRHLLASTANVLAIIEATSRGAGAPKDPPGTLAPAEFATFDEVRRALVETSERLAAVRTRLVEPVNYEVTVEHAFFGPLNCRAWFLFQRIHDADHTRQVERLTRSDGFPS